MVEVKGASALSIDFFVMTPEDVGSNPSSGEIFIVIKNYFISNISDQIKKQKDWTTYILRPGWWMLV